jgi:hypothetical protein
MEQVMSESQTNGSKPFDPLDPFRGMRDAYLDAMAKTMVEAVNSDAYAQASGAMLDNTLTMSAPFREAMEKTILQVLQQLSLPSRQDIVVLAERFTNLEMRLDDMDATLDGFEGKLQKSMLPVLQQLLLLTQGVTNLAARLDIRDAAAKTSRVQPIAARGKAVVATPPERKARAITKKRIPAGEQALPAKRAASRKGAR